jgi:alpha-mannosidase
MFPVGAGATDAEMVRAEGQYALVHRPLTPPAPKTDWVEPPDPTQHTLGAVALGPLALLTKGLPEYEARPAENGPELCLTLLRCVGLISQPTGAISTRPLGAGPQTPTPEGQCLGRHECEYALLPRADELDDTALLRAAQDYRHGFLVAGEAAYFDSPVNLEGDVVFSCLKGAEDDDGLIMRCFNPTATPSTVRIAGHFAVERVRLDETPTETGLELRPGEIATVRLRPL